MAPEAFDCGAQALAFRTRHVLDSLVADHRHAGYAHMLGGGS